MNTKSPPAAPVLMVHILRALQDGRRHTLEEIELVVATSCELTEQEWKELVPREVQQQWRRAFAECLEQLRVLHLAYSPGPGVLEGTRFSREVLEENPVEITRPWLRQFPEFLMLEYREKYGFFPPPDAPPPPAGPARSAPVMGGRMSLIGGLPPVDEHLLHDPRNVPVWFGTNRVPHDPENLALGFSGGNGPTVYRGRCVVNIPEGHRTAELKPGMLEALDRGTEGLVLRSVTGFAEEAFWDGIKAELATAGPADSALLFIHGFNVGFPEAALRTAQLRYDLKMAHAAFYSWPSRNKVLHYDEDLQSASMAVPFLAAFLEAHAGQVARAGLKLHVLAHSMGNHVLLHSLRSLVTRASPPKLASVTFAAPDVDQEDFKRWVAEVLPLAPLRTLYASERDFALEISGGMRDRPRAGKLPPVTYLAGVDTVDVTQIDLSQLGHGYYAAARPVITDMHQLMHFNATPGMRASLREPIPPPQEKYWVIK